MQNLTVAILFLQALAIGAATPFLSAISGNDSPLGATSTHDMLEELIAAQNQTTSALRNWTETMHVGFQKIESSLGNLRRESQNSHRIFTSQPLLPLYKSVPGHPSLELYNFSASSEPHPVEVGGIPDFNVTDITIEALMGYSENQINRLEWQYNVKFPGMFAVPISKCLPCACRHLVSTFPGHCSSLVQ
jgi:hypothetical protein